MDVIKGTIFAFQIPLPLDSQTNYPIINMFYKYQLGNHLENQY